MRIALFSGNYNYLREGANQALNRLVGWLERVAGHEVRVYSPVTDTPAFEPEGTLVPVHSITLPLRSEFRLATGLSRAIRDDIRAFAPHIIHVSTPDILNTRAQSFAKELGIPIIASQHTLFETYLDYYHLGWLRPLADAHLARFYRRSDHVLVPTQALATDMRQMRGDERVDVWSRGVEHSLFNPARYDHAWRQKNGLADHEIAVLFFGRLVLEKGIANYVSVIEHLQREGLPVRPLLVGEGPGKSAFSSLKNSIMTGHLDGEELARAVSSADVFYHPSTTETFGNVVLEGMAAGLPIVAADAAGSRALLRDGAAGILCNPGDPLGASKALSDLIRSPVHRRHLSHAARENSLAYSWDKASASVELAYKSTLAMMTDNISDAAN